MTKSGFKTKKEAEQPGLKAYNEFMHNGEAFVPSDISAQILYGTCNFTLNMLNYLCRSSTFPPCHYSNCGRQTCFYYNAQEGFCP